MLKNARLNTKISVCFSLLLAFITAVACVVLAEFYRDSSLRQSGLLLQTVGDAAVQQLEMTFDEMDRISARLFFSSEISEAMKDAAASTGQSEYFEEHYSMQDTVRSRIFSIVSTSNSDTTVNLYNRNAFISNRYTQCFWGRIQASMEDGRQYGGSLRAARRLLDDGLLRQQLVYFPDPELHQLQHQEGAWKGADP